MTDGLGLGDAYSATLSRITGQGGKKAKLGVEALMWISHSERPLKSDELRHALAVEIGSLNFNSDNVPSIGTLLACCQGLVVVDKDTSAVRLIHFTVQEYLRARPELFGTPHSTIAETCLSYLNSQQVNALPARPSPDLRGAPFLEYSSLYWGIHAKRDLSDCAKLLALKLFDDLHSHISIQILLQAQKLYVYRIDFDKLSLFNGLHCASIFGIDEIVAGLVEVEGCDINQKDCVGNTALMWAAQNGHEGIVKILLGRDDVDPNKPGQYGQTPLRCAALAGHEGVVKYLLAWDDWFVGMKRFTSWLGNYISPYDQTESSDTCITPIKIALIGDGVDGTIDLIFENIKNGISYHKIVDIPKHPRFLSYYSARGSHGTVLASLICQMCPAVDLYIARLNCDHKCQIMIDSAIKVFSFTFYLHYY